MKNYQKDFRFIVSELQETINKLDDEFYKSLEVVINIFRETIISNRNILLCGNGGSAADCQHMAAELVGRFKKERRPFRAISLTTDSAILTCISNDFKYEEIFSRQIDAIGKKNDLLIAISTSGKSPNILNALLKAKEKDIKTISILGNKGGEAKQLSNNSIIVPSSCTARIQEIHTLIIHIICEMLEDL